MFNNKRIKRLEARILKIELNEREFLDSLKGLLKAHDLHTANIKQLIDNMEALNSIIFQSDGKSQA